MINKKLFLSYSSIKVFLNCKRRFKFKYIDKITAAQPISGKYISFGESIHKAMGQFNMITDENYRTLDNLHILLRRNWVRKGYDTLEEERSFGIKGLEMLTNYHHDPKDVGKRLIIEEMIKKDLNNGFVLCGKLDAAFSRSDDLLEVTDYKTGCSIDPIDKLQLSIYVLLTSERLGQYPQVISNYYLAHNDKSEMLVDEDYIEQSYQFINTICENIRIENDYPCTPTPYCERNCEYYENCEAAKDKNNIIINELKIHGLHSNDKLIF